MKNIVITGGSRGIGFGLAKEFLLAGHRVMISGRNENTLSEARKMLRSETNNPAIEFIVSDATRPDEMTRLWDAAAKYGPVEIWVNNAGLGQDTGMVHELDEEMISNILDVNIKGLILCSRMCVKKMEQQGFGALYNMAGFGSDGRKMSGMSVYGTTKNAVQYFTESLALETKNTPVIVGTISPGMVVTSMLTDPVKEDTASHREAVKIFHILADRVETVSPYLVAKMLNNKKNGADIRWLNSRKIMGRFMKNIFVKRKVEGIPEFP